MSTQYATFVSRDDGFPVVTLSDGQGREVKIAPAAGFNAFSFRTLHNGAPYELFVAPASDEALRGGGFGFGCPILFPFPNRTRNGQYRFGGQTYQLDAKWKDGNAIHGLVHSCAWTILESGADGEQAPGSQPQFAPTSTRRFCGSIPSTANYESHIPCSMLR
jgi:galactose mutarotase-like enzyme